MCADWQVLPVAGCVVEERHAMKRTSKMPLIRLVSAVGVVGLSLIGSSLTASAGTSTTATVSLTAYTGTGAGALNMSVPGTISATQALTGSQVTVNLSDAVPTASSTVLDPCSSTTNAPGGSAPNTCTTGIDVNNLLSSNTAGWNVSLYYSQFTCSTCSPAQTLPTSALYNTPTTTQWSCDSSGCSLADNTTASGDSGLVPAATVSTTSGSPTVIQAANSQANTTTATPPYGYGVGDQSSGAGLVLTIPASTVAGSYTSTFTFAIATGP